MIPENIKTRISSNGKLRSQLNIIKELVLENPESEYAKSILHAMRLKYWLGSKRINYNTIFQDAWNKFLPDQSVEIFEIDGTKFINDDSFKYEYVDIFLTDKSLQTSFTDKEQVIAAKILSLLAPEGSYEMNEVQIRKNDYIIDAGANMGLFSIFAAKKGAKQVYAFEPQKAAIEILKNNILINSLFEYIKIIPLGLSEKNEVAELSHSKNGHIGGSIVLKRNENGDAESIECVDLDSWVSNNKISHIDFIKADIEGAERMFLKGATKVLAEFAPRLAICTYHFPDDPQILEGIIINANPKYIIEHTSHKLFAHVP